MLHIFTDKMAPIVPCWKACHQTIGRKDGPHERWRATFANTGEMGLSQEELAQRALVSETHPVALGNGADATRCPVPPHPVPDFWCNHRRLGLRRCGRDARHGSSGSARLPRSNHPTRSSHRNERVRPYHGWPDGSSHGWQRGPALPGSDLRDHVHSPNHARTGACCHRAIRRRGTESPR